MHQVSETTIGFDLHCKEFVVDGVPLVVSRTHIIVFCGTEVYTHIPPGTCRISTCSFTKYGVHPLTILGVIRKPCLSVMAHTGTMDATGSHILG